MIVHNLPESDKPSPEERRTEDEMHMKDIAEQLGVDEIEIREVTRLGKRTNRPRPTKVKLDSVTQKRQLLEKAKHLKDHEATAETFLVPDLSKLARDKNRKLRIELNERKEKGERRKEKGESNLIIRRGQIIGQEERDTTQRQNSQTSNSRGGYIRGRGHPIGLRGSDIGSRGRTFRRQSNREEQHPFRAVGGTPGVTGGY